MLIIIVVIIVFLKKPVSEKYIIGFSQPTMADLWRQTMLMEIQHELIFHPEMELITTDAENNSEKQVADIRRLVASGIDLLIVSPNESQPLTAIVEEVYRRGIPVILIDRKIESENFTAYIGGDNYEIGYEAGRFAAQMLNGKGNILEIWGLRGSSPARERHEGFVSGIGEFNDVQIAHEINGEWEIDVARDAMRKHLETDTSFNLIFAHNDPMAFGASEAIKTLKGANDIYIIGVDGLPGPDGGIQAILDDKIDATLLYPTGGKQAIELSWKILNNEPFEKETELNTIVIDENNAMGFKIQTDEIISLHDRIATSKQILDIHLKKFYSQQFWLTIALISLFAVIIMVALLTRAFRNKARANQKLEMQKQEITRQNEELKRISQKLEEATRAKVRFFTNISHEIRTPLTLIIGPLESLLSSPNLQATQKQQLEMMLRNAQRLLRLINQLMDFRKIENEKMQLHAGQHDIVEFVKDICQAFEELAERKMIDFTFRSAEESLMLYFDKNKMDKIMFNILSNAFKFTQSKGSIKIKLKKTQYAFEGKEKDAVEIRFSDNGPGIPAIHLPRIFERFYQVENHSEGILLGSGIGLPLTKGFVDLHHGIVNVESEEGAGTTFTLYFQLGTSHLKEDEIILEENKYDRIDKGIIKSADAIQSEEAEAPEKQKEISYEDKPLLLIVEDNPDVSKFIQSSLVEEYRIMTAFNGIEAFEKMYIEEPDLIISDVMMPEMDGLEFTRKLKSDIRTCHIPLILLTARTSYDHKLEGLETGADSYIPKPFNQKHLQVRVNQLIESRRNIRKYYQSDPVSAFTTDNKLSQLDSNFLKKCNRIIEENLTQSDFSVEQLSAEVGLSRVHVYRKIKHLTGFSVSEFIRNIKLRKASVMLLESGKSVAEVAYDIGFSSPSYFSKCFKDLYKVAPSEYVQQKKG